MKQLARYDKGFIEGTTSVTAEGFLKCDAIVTRTGVFTYQNPDGTMRRELRHPEDVLNSESLKSLEMIPVTNGHPEERLITGENAQRLSVGFTGETVKTEGKFIFTNFIVSDNEAVQDVIERGKNQLSLGYTVDLLDETGEYEGEEYDFRQSNIRYNHLSLVDSARAGGKARIALDENDAQEISQNEGKEMTKRKVKIDKGEYLVEEEVATSVESLVESLRMMEEQKGSLEEEMSSMKTQLEKALAERDTAVAEAEKMLAETEESNSETTTEEKTDSKEFNKRVQERVGLLKVAETCLDQTDLNQIHILEDNDIKKKIIIAKQPKADLRDKSEIYIKARYDSIVEDFSNIKVMVKGTKIDGKSKNEVSSADDARSDMIGRMKNSYKLGGK